MTVVLVGLTVGPGRVAAMPTSLNSSTSVIASFSAGCPGSLTCSISMASFRSAERTDDSTFELSYENHRARLHCSIGDPRVSKSTEPPSA